MPYFELICTNCGKESRINLYELLEHTIPLEVKVNNQVLAFALRPLYELKINLSAFRKLVQLALVQRRRKRAVSPRFLKIHLKTPPFSKLVCSVALAPTPNRRLEAA